jgi:hypothetical protein
MKATTETAQESWPCPISRTFAQSQPTCRGHGCPLWRWALGKPHARAVNAVAEQIGDKSASKAASAAIVAQDPVAHGLHGFCGLGGAA